MGVVPDAVAGQRPGYADADVKVWRTFPMTLPMKREEQEQAGQEGPAQIDGRLFRDGLMNDV